MFGYLGPNGSGKTTTLKVLMGLVFAQAGTARLLGQSIGAALVALIFGLAQQPGGSHGATAAILIAAGFAGAGVLASLSRLADFSQMTARGRAAELREPAE